MKNLLLLICLSLGSILQTQAQTFCSQNADFVFDYGEDYSSLITANGNSTTFSNKTIAIHGNLIMQGNLHFIDCDLYMAPDATIESYDPNYNILEITNTTIQACDASLWTGIIYNSGFVNIQNSIIRDAKTAFSALGINQNTKFTIKNSQFLNNYNHLSISEDIDLTSSIISTTLDVQGYLLPPYQNIYWSETAIDILKVSDWSIGVYVVKTYDSQGKLVGAQKLIKNK